jgi:hypothetical protein
MRFGQGDLPLVFFPAKGEVLPEPLGVVLIFGSWNFPFGESNHLFSCSGVVLLHSQVISFKESLCYKCMFGTRRIYILFGKSLFISKV